MDCTNFKCLGTFSNNHACKSILIHITYNEMNIKSDCIITFIRYCLDEITTNFDIIHDIYSRRWNIWKKSYPKLVKTTTKPPPTTYNQTLSKVRLLLQKSTSINIKSFRKSNATYYMYLYDFYAGGINTITMQSSMLGVHEGAWLASPNMQWVV